jgi:hypothetical protein
MLRPATLTSNDASDTSVETSDETKVRLSARFLVPALTSASSNSRRVSLVFPALTWLDAETVMSGASTIFARSTEAFFERFVQATVGCPSQASAIPGVTAMPALCPSAAGDARQSPLGISQLEINRQFDARTLEQACTSHARQ